MRKPTPVQWGILGAAAALGAVLLLSFRRVPRVSRQTFPEGGAPAAPPGAGHPTSVLSGFDYAQTSAGKPRFQIHADHTVGFAQGAGLPSTWYGLEAVKLTLFSEQGEPFKVRSDRADYDPRTKAMHLKDNVVMTDSSGTNLRTARVDYDPARSRLLVPQPIEMLRGGMSGHARSADYDAQTRELAFAGPVTVEGNPTAGPSAAKSPFSTLHSDRGVYRRSTGEIELIGHVDGTRGADHFSSDSLKLRLTNENRIDRAIAEGSVTGSVASAPGRPPQIFSAARATLDFESGGGLERVLLDGTPARIEAVPSPQEPGSRRIEARLITLGYQADRLRAARAEGAARMEKSGLGPKGEDRRETIRADKVDASFAAVDGALESARFAGNVVAVSPDATARAPSGVFEAADNRTTFFAAEGRDAEVVAPRGKIVGGRIDVRTDPSRLTATGSPRAFLKPSAENRGLPEFLSSSRKPTRAKADRIELDDGARTATFAGGAALWQGSNALFGNRIELFDADRSATADGSVRAVALSAPGPRENAELLTTVTGDAMKYQEGTRTARFEHHVRATRGSQAAEGDAAESRFNSKNQIERTELSGHVTFQDPATGRQGSGDRAVDEPLAGVTTLFGEPAVARDSRGNRITAAILTFRKDSGSVDAKAKEGQKIETVYQTSGQAHGRASGRAN